MIEKPALIRRYVVDHELGSGGMGEVYLAYPPAPWLASLLKSEMYGGGRTVDTSGGDGYVGHGSSFR